MGPPASQDGRAGSWSGSGRSASSLPQPGRPRWSSANRLPAIRSV